MYEKLHKLQWIDGILGLGLLMLAIGIGMNVSDKFKQPQVTLIKAGITPTIVVQGDNKVTFDIGGEVINPGVYKLAKGSRIGDALTTANGLNAMADREWVEKNINRAEEIRDGMKIYIPNKSESSKVESPTTAGRLKVLGKEIVNINLAGAEELDKLTGIGPAIAQRIIDYREANGGFKDVQEIKMVSGVGDKLYEKIKDEIGI